MTAFHSYYMFFYSYNFLHQKIDQKQPCFRQHILHRDESIYNRSPMKRLSFRIQIKIFIIHLFDLYFDTLKLFFPGECSLNEMSAVFNLVFKRSITLTCL